ncbi:MAG TPA: DHA2 family efflux MFS transporter permease subunit, partial [Puia sp.]
MPVTGSKKWIITITVILCSMLELIDTSIVNVVTNEMMANLGATMSEVSWVIAAYSIANVIIVPMTGWLSRAFGRKNYYVISVAIFTVSSFLCGHSGNIWELVAWRFVQGIGGGALLATSQAILVETFPVEELGLANAIFGAGVVLGPTIGPALGGYIVDNLSWEWIFYVNIPLGIVAIFLALHYITGAKQPEDPDKKKPVDWWGIALLCVGVGSLQLVLEQGEREDWFESRMIVTASVAAVFGILCFIWRELWCKYPIVDLRVLKNRSLAAGTFLMFIIGYGLYASIFVYPIFVQSFLGATATQTGLSLLPGALISAFFMPAIGVMLKKGVQPKLMILVGFILFAIFTFLSNKAMTAGSAVSDFFWPLILRGIALGFVFAPLSTMSLAGLKGDDLSQGSGLTNMMRQLGGSFSVAICSVQIEHAYAKHRTTILSHVSPYDAPTNERLQQLNSLMLYKNHAPNAAYDAALKVMDGTVYKQAMILSYMDVFIYLGAFFVICMPMILLAKNMKKGEAI